MTTWSAQLINYAKACVKPAYDYFKKKIDEDLAFPLSIFKHARLFDPSKDVDIHPTTSDVNGLIADFSIFGL